MFLELSELLTVLPHHCNELSLFFLLLTYAILIELDLLVNGRHLLANLVLQGGLNGSLFKILLIYLLLHGFHLLLAFSTKLFILDIETFRFLNQLAVFTSRFLHVVTHLVLDLGDVVVEAGYDLLALGSLLSLDCVVLVLELLVLSIELTSDRLKPLLHQISFGVAVLVLHGLPVQKLGLGL